MKYYIVASTVDKKPVIFDIAFTYKGAKKFISNYNKKVDQFVHSETFKNYWASVKYINSEDFQRTLNVVGVSNSMQKAIENRDRQKRKYLHYADTLEIFLNDKDCPENLLGEYENFIHVVNRPKLINFSL